MILVVKRALISVQLYDLNRRKMRDGNCPIYNELGVNVKQKLRPLNLNLGLLSITKLYKVIQFC